MGDGQSTQYQPIYKRIPWSWVLCWIALPNLAVIAMWPIGGPSMAAPIFLCGLIAILVAQSQSKIIRILGILLVFFMILAAYITKSFNIDLINIVYVTDYVQEVDFFRSPEYLAAAFLLLLSLAAAIYFGIRSPKFKSREQFLLAMGFVALLVNADMVATAGTRGGYMASAPAGTPADGAIIQAGITPENVNARNLVVIIVESWGVPTDPRAKAVDSKIFDPAQWSDRYEVSQGKALYFGSTTNSEVREWCGEWADHHSFDFDNSNCLPKQFKEEGFNTLAFHAFAPEFFDRNIWYPKLGFEQIEFGPDLLSRGADFCDGVFGGACDRDIPPMIGETMRKSKADRNLVYWLTLNAHLPIMSDKKLGTDKCSLGPKEWREDYPMLCRSYAVLDQTADVITKEIMDEKFPESDIVIVGDHMPPFFPRAIRTQFDSAHVPWIYLRNRDAVERQNTANTPTATKIAQASASK